MRNIRKLVLLFILCAALTAPAVLAQPAPDANSVLVLLPTVDAGFGLETGEATALGFTVVTATAAQWGARNLADFASFRALILGDPHCPTGTASLAAAEANRATWSPAVDGNIIIIGTDPEWHAHVRGEAGAVTLTNNGIDFAGDIANKTGLYLTLSCYYHFLGVGGTPVDVLDQFGAFTVLGGGNAGSINNAHIVAVHPALAGLTDAALSNWSNSVHEAFDGFPGDFLPLVIGQDFGGAGTLNFPDGSSGVPYVLARGETLSPIRCGDGVLDLGEECDDGNTDNGDGCSAQCTIEEIVCDPDPRSQGYWHRQCLGVPAGEGGIDPGRNGRGPQESQEADFKPVLMPAVTTQLENLMFEFGGACAAGMDADPASDQCEKAIKQTTALLFNVAAGLLQDGCTIDVSAQGCNSTNVGDLIDELAALINTGDDGACSIAQACADAVNTGGALVESTIVVTPDDPNDPAAPNQTVVNSLPGGSGDPNAPVVHAAGGQATTGEPVNELPADMPEDLDAFGVPLYLSTQTVEDAAEPVAEEPEQVAEDDLQTLQTLQRHLAVLANPSAPETAIDISTDALLTALSGGFDPEIRLEIMQGLIGAADVTYESLLAEHLVNLQAEAEAFGREDLAREAVRLLKRLEASE